MARQRRDLVYITSGTRGVQLILADTLLHTVRVAALTILAVPVIALVIATAGRMLRFTTDITYLYAAVVYAAPVTLSEDAPFLVEAVRR